MYCKKCGAKIDSYASNCPFCGEPVANNSVEATYSTNTNLENHKTLGSWVLALIISCIPIVGFIMMLVWAFGNETKSNPTFRNWARANLVLQVIIYVLSIIFTFVAASYILDLFSEFANL